jgi:hypothetical protein
MCGRVGEEIKGMKRGGGGRLLDLALVLPHWLFVDSLYVYITRNVLKNNKI